VNVAQSEITPDEACDDDFDIQPEIQAAFDLADFVLVRNAACGKLLFATNSCKNFGSVISCELARTLLGSVGNCTLIDRDLHVVRQSRGRGCRRRFLCFFAQLSITRPTARCKRSRLAEPVQRPSATYRATLQ
jgi:predicted outer membrane repeat protein